MEQSALIAILLALFWEHNFVLEHVVIQYSFVFFSNPAAPTHIGSAVKNPVKASGPVNGNECYFWRTTGCSYGDKCRNAHIPAHKGIDKKPWQRDQ